MRWLLISFLFLSGCSAINKVTVSNASDFARPEAMAEVPAMLGSVVMDSTGVEIPSQVTFDGMLIFQPHLDAGESATFTIRKGKPGEFERRTFGRAYPERYDDFAWENDRVAFRIYGPALKPVDGPSNGIDAWYKRTDKLILDKWYADDLAGRASYHRDHGEGLDDYKVGRTLGAGAMAPMMGDSLVLGENYERAELLESGPLRTTFKLWYAGGETRTISLDAGSRLTKVIQAYPPENVPDSVAAGFPIRQGMNSKAYVGGNYMLVTEPDTPLAQGVFLGLVLEGKFSPKSGHLTLTAPYSGPVAYYTGYGWSAAGMAQEDFLDYLMQFSQELEEPLEITIWKK